MSEFTDMNIIKHSGFVDYHIQPPRRTEQTVYTNPTDITDKQYVNNRIKDKRVSCITG